jgi:hypothetical protein
MKRAVSMLGRAWLTIVLSAFCACSEEASTGVLVSIHGDDEVAAQLTRIQVLLYAFDQRDESMPVEDRPFDLASDGLTLPFSFVILKGQAQRFLLVVKGFRAGSKEPVIEQKAIASFQDERTELLRIVLSAVCYDLAEPCPSLDETCYPTRRGGVEAGSCGDVPVVTTEPVAAGQELDADLGAVEARDADDFDASADAGDASPPDFEPDDSGAITSAGSVDGAMDGASLGCSQDNPSSACRDAGSVTKEGGSLGPDAGSASHDASTPNTDAGSASPDTGSVRPGCAGSNVCVGMTNGIPFSYACVDATDADAGYTCRGLFPDWPLSDPPNRFTESGGVVRDAKTGLSWQRNIDAVDRSASEAATYCSSMAGGFRLPTRAELESIADLTVREPSAIDQSAFPGTPGTWFWTSSPYVGSAGFHWLVHFYNGSLYYQGPTFREARVRCVR